MPKDTPKIIYVDKLTPPISGFTNNLDVIKYNCNLINPDILKGISTEMAEANNITSSFPAGRYICILAIYLDTKQYSMMMYDLKNRDDILYKMIDSLSHEDAEIREMIIRSFNVIRAHFVEWQYDYELKEGLPPA